MNTFHLIDLISQAKAVQSLLRGKSAEEKIEWLSAHGSIAVKPKTQQDERQCFWFEAMYDRKLFSLTKLIECFEAIAPEIIRFPSLNADALRSRVENFIDRFEEQGADDR